MPFTLEEARAGHDLVQQRVRQAETALASAQSRRERKQAEADLSQAKLALVSSEAGLRSLEQQHAASAPPPSSAAPRRSGADPLAMSTVIEWLRGFGEVRSRQGDDLEENPHAPGQFYYSTGEARTAIVVWGAEHDWTISIFSAARLGMRPTVELYRYVTRWRTSSPYGAPYLIESEDGRTAAVMCETTFNHAQLAEDNTSNRLIYSTIDLVGDVAVRIGRDLAGADGQPPTTLRHTGMEFLLTWWEVEDPRIKQLLRRPL